MLHVERGYLGGPWKTFPNPTGVCEKRSSGKVIQIGILAFRPPNQGLDCSFCRWIAGHGLAQKEYVFTDTGSPGHLASSCYSEP